MLVKALLVALVVFLGQMDEMTLEFQTTRAIVTGPVVGLLLGDVQTGLLVGATVEMMFLSNVIVGAAGIPDVTMASAIATGLAILGKVPPQTAISIAAVVAVFGQLMGTIRLSVFGVFFAHRADKPAREGDMKKVFMTNIWGVIAICAILFALPTFIAIYFGTDVVTNMVNHMPMVVLNGLSKGSGLLAAVGFGMLLSMLTEKKLFPFMFIGFVLSAFMNVNIIGIVILSIATAILYVSFTSKKNSGGVQYE